MFGSHFPWVVAWKGRKLGVVSRVLLYEEASEKNIDGASGDFIQEFGKKPVRRPSTQIQVLKLKPQYPSTNRVELVICSSRRLSLTYAILINSQVFLVSHSSPRKSSSIIDMAYHQNIPGGTVPMAPAVQPTIQTSGVPISQGPNVVVERPMAALPTANPNPGMAAMPGMTTTYPQTNNLGVGQVMQSGWKDHRGDSDPHRHHGPGQVTYDKWCKVDGGTRIAEITVTTTIIMDIMGIITHLTLT
ncbi:hypothetical protein K435DRAFT_912366 [Dendrothele bispora CBS 962.96]|uniref:Uncharacterized protein n=1 Tax=Dendrothele bispora (strain CBS 962.96) TaxID=1314807 RepID=A0A4S8LLU5_DENBC|nr:hypothetical protein K435DRAFT_912366 [Dendrothele bispora CBS 962.96]